MKHMFQPYLTKFILVFFDDILVYNIDWEHYLQHLVVVFKTLQQQQLFGNKKKCLFGRAKIDYLGHRIFRAGVATDPVKIQVM